MRVRAYRLERKLTQEQLAESVDRSVETISNLERGVSFPSDGTLQRLAESLGVDIQDLYLDKIADTGAHSLEYFQSIEILKAMDEKKIKMAFAILRIIGDS